MRVGGAVQPNVGVMCSSRRKMRKKIRKEKKERLKAYFERKKTRKGSKIKDSAVEHPRASGSERHSLQPVTKSVNNDKDSTSRGRNRKLKRRVGFGIREEVKANVSYPKDSTKFRSRVFSKVHQFRYSRQAALIANSKEDKEIGRLEKKLGLKKGKKLPSTFTDEGLDFLLEVADIEIAPTEVEQVAEKEANHDDSDAERCKASDVLSGVQSEKKRLPLQVQHQEWVNNDTGTTDVEQSVVVKYVPPQLRQTSEDNKQSQNLQRLHRVLCGLINRLSEHNVKLIAREVEQLFHENSHNDMCKTLTECILDSCVKSSFVGDQILMENVLLLGLVCHKEGVEVCSFFLEMLVKKLENTYEKDREKPSKATANIVMLFAFLYILQMVHCCLVYDLVRKFVTSFWELDIEFLLMLLNWVGPQLRRDDPLALKDIVVAVEAKASSMTYNVDEKSRVQFMLNTIAALKNNNFRKLRHDSIAIECYRQRYQELTKGKRSADFPLRMGLSDLLNADSSGRWWIVGSSWSGGEVGKATRLNEHDMTGVSDLRMLTLAHQQRMTSDARRTIFCVLMSGDDYVDAFEKLLKLNLKDKQSREIVHVVLDCCLQEQPFNPFYAHLSEKLCQYKRSYQVTLQYSIWDRLKAVGSLTDTNRHNLAKLLIHLFITKAMSISVLKVVEFSELEDSSVQFYSFLLRNLLCQSEMMLQAVFARIADFPDLHHLREGLRVFMHHYMLKKTLNSEEKKWKKKIRLAEKSMQIGMVTGRLNTSSML